MTKFELEIGNTDATYDFMIKSFHDYSIGTLARAMILNPMHANLPRVFFQHVIDSLIKMLTIDQWTSVEEIFQRKMCDRIGPLVGHSSDDNSRRRKLMVQKMLKTGGDRYDPIGKENSFVFTAKKIFKEDGGWMISDVGDQDWIHNGKKYICHTLGDGKLVLMNHVKLLVDKVSVFKHRLTKEHVRRGRDNWKIAQQLAFKCVQESFNDLISGNIENCPPDSTCGTKIYLNVIWHYIEIFASPVMPLKGRIFFAGLVVKFLAVEKFCCLGRGFDIKKQVYFQSMLPGYHIIVPLCSSYDLLLS